MSPIVEEILQLLPDDLREEWDERAAIMQFDGGLFREYAEALSLLRTLRKLITKELLEKQYLILKGEAHE